MRPIALLLLLAPAWAQNVIVVDAAGGGDHLDLPAAVQAASAGDVLLVRAGSYTAPTLVKGMTIVAEPGEKVLVRGTTRVLGTGPKRPVLLSGLELRHRNNKVEPALEVSQCKGAVRLDQVFLFGGGEGFLGQGPGADAAEVLDSGDVAVMRSEFLGGAAGEDEFGGPGQSFRSGAGMSVHDSRVAAWRSFFVGGDGNDAALLLSSAGEGGRGMDLSQQGKLFAYLNLFRGGRGGDSLDFSSDWCGRGGAGFYARQHAKTVEQSCSFVGGKGGMATNFPKVCDDGAPFDVVGPFVSMPGLPRGLEGPRVLREGETGQFIFYGGGGDRVSLVWSERTRFRHAPYFEGGWISPPTAMALDPIGTIDGSGQLHWSFTQPDLASGVEAQVVYVQLFTRRNDGSVHLGSPITLVALDSSF